MITQEQFANAWREIPAYRDGAAYVSDLALSSMWGDAQETDIPQDRIEYIQRMWDVYHMTMRDIIDESGMTQQSFGVQFLIPRRTIEDWSTGKRTPPDYVKIMIAKMLGML